MRTQLTELLGIEFPIFQGGMAWASDMNLVSAVSNGGGAGIIGTARRDKEWTREEIRRVKALTDKPFGVNVALHTPTKDEVMEAVLEEGVAFVTMGAGNPTPYIPRLREAGIKAIPIVPDSRRAKKVAEAGADALIVEGLDSGGHIGTQTTMALLTNIPPEVNIPVIAAGGIADGRGLAAALMMGAVGVQLGTIFLAAEECNIHPNAKQRLLESKDYESVVTGFTLGDMCRGIRNKLTDQALEMERRGATRAELEPFVTGSLRKAMQEGDMENGMLMVSLSVNVINEILPAREIMQRMVRSAEQVLAETAKKYAV